jgi:pantoate--beta-alanine ligase
MLILKRIQDIQNRLKRFRNQAKSIGFVPTMGALHQGHASLIIMSNKYSDITVCSIFVNPTQFNDKADFDKYPITIDRDIAILTDLGCDILFLPSVTEMYPHGLKYKSQINFGYLAETLEGEHRPGHFNGMAQIVEKLLRLVEPDGLFMGQKDFQQQLIVKALIRKRKFKTKLFVCETTREKDGLALSSRNMRLDLKARVVALEISKALKKVKSGLRTSDIDSLAKAGFKRLSTIEGMTPEYFEIRNAETLRPAKKKSEKLVALAAVKVGGVRLIDNLLLN